MALQTAKVRSSAARQPTNRHVSRPGCSDLGVVFSFRPPSNPGMPTRRTGAGCRPRTLPITIRCRHLLRQDSLSNFPPGRACIICPITGDGRHTSEDGVGRCTCNASRSGTILIFKWIAVLGRWLHRSQWSLFCCMKNGGRRSLLQQYLRTRFTLPIGDSDTCNQFCRGG